MSLVSLPALAWSPVPPAPPPEICESCRQRPALQPNCAPKLEQSASPLQVTSHTLPLASPQPGSQDAEAERLLQFAWAVHGLVHTPQRQVRPPEQESVHCCKKCVSLSPPEADSSWQPANKPLSAKIQAQAPPKILETARLVIRNLRPLAPARLALPSSRRRRHRR